MNSNSEDCITAISSKSVQFNIVLEKSEEHVSLLFEAVENVAIFERFRDLWKYDVESVKEFNAAYVGCGRKWPKKRRPPDARKSRKSSLPDGRPIVEPRERVETGGGDVGFERSFEGCEIDDLVNMLARAARDCADVNDDEDDSDADVVDVKDEVVWEDGGRPATTVVADSSSVAVKLEDGRDDFVVVSKRSNERHDATRLSDVNGLTEDETSTSLSDRRSHLTDVNGLTEDVTVVDLGGEKDSNVASSLSLSTRSEMTTAAATAPAADRRKRAPSSGFNGLTNNKLPMKSKLKKKMKLKGKSKKNLKMSKTGVCPHCGVYYGNLAQHVFTYCAKNPDRRRAYHCCYCKLKTTSREALAEHKRTHVLQRDFKCEMCDSGFFTRQRLIRHMRYVHLVGNNPVKIYTCDVCDKRFTYRSHWDRHQTVHKEERSVQCEMCGKFFKNRHNVHNHQMRMHLVQMREGMGPFPYFCEKCGEGFAHLGSHRSCARARKPRVRNNRPNAGNSNDERKSASVHDNEQKLPTNVAAVKWANVPEYSSAT